MLAVLISIATGTTVKAALFTSVVVSFTRTAVEITLSSTSYNCKSKIFNGVTNEGKSSDVTLT